MRVVIGGTGGIGKELARVLMAVTTNRALLNVESEESIAAWCAPERWTMENEPLHIVNATGVSISAMLHKAQLLDIEHMLRVNLISHVLLLKHLRPLFKQLLPGSTYTAIGSVTVDIAPVGTGVYTASKAALRGLVPIAAREFAPFARINLLEAGYTELGMIAQVPDHAALIRTIPVRRLGRIEDLKLACEYIMDNEYMTGSILKVNGGLAA